MRNNYYLARMLAAVTALLSAAVMAACGRGAETEPQTALTFAETAVAETAAETPEPSPDVRQSDTAAAETDAPEETEKTAEPPAAGYEDGTRTVYTHRELSDLLLERGYLENVDGFAYGPYLNPGERDMVQVGAVPGGTEGTADVTRIECQCFRYPELGIRAISFPTCFHMDGEVLEYRDGVLRTVRMPDDQFEVFYGAPVQPDGNDYTVVQLIDTDAEREAGGRIYGDDREFTDGCVLDNVTSYPGAFARASKDYLYGVAVGCRRTDLEMGTGTVSELSTREVIRRLWAYPVPEPFTDDPLHVMQKDGYWYVYATTGVVKELSDGSGDPYSEDIGYLFRVRDGVSQGVCVKLRNYDRKLAPKVLDYILNYSLEFYDIDTIRYDAYGENGERWYELCENFFCQ